MNAREQRYAAALQGVASCATKCPCCEMHARVAQEALAEPPPALCPCGRTICKTCGFPRVEDAPASGPVGYGTMVGGD